MKKDRQFSAMAMGLAGNIVFGFSFLFSKTAFGLENVEVTPFILLFYRFLTAFLVMNIILLFRPRLLSLKGKPWWKLCILGLLQPVLYFIFENYALKNTDTVLSAVMIALVPIVALVFGALFMHEKPGKGQIFFALLSVAGVAVISALRSAGGETPVYVIFLLIGAMLSAAFFNLVSRGTAATFSAFERTYMMFALSVAVFAVLALWENRADFTRLILPLTVPAFDLSVLFLGVCSSVFAFFAVNYANTYLPLSRSTAFSNITTVVSVFAGIVILKEPYDFRILLSAAAIVIGVFGVQKCRKEK